MPAIPSVLGLKKSFGFGDRLGLATPGHLAAALEHPRFHGIFAQQSIRELARTERTPEEVMSAASRALDNAGFEGLWGADADHLKTPEDVRRTAAAGFTFFTIDPSSYVEEGVSQLGETELLDALGQVEREGIVSRGDYLDRTFPMQSFEVKFSPASFARAAIKYGRAIVHAANMMHEIRRHRPDADIEVSVDETADPTTPEEHLFVANEFRRRGLAFTSLAPRFVGAFEKGIDYKGDLERFETELLKHVEIAEAFGPYKLSVHSGSDKFSIYPIIGRCCGDRLHVKTAGTSYLEALRVVARSNPELFLAITRYAVTRFGADRATYHISTTDEEARSLTSAPPSNFEHAWLDQDAGRQVLHVTFGSVLSQGRAPDGGRFHEAILRELEDHAELHAELLREHLGKHLRLLEAG